MQIRLLIIAWFSRSDFVHWMMRASEIAGTDRHGRIRVPPYGGKDRESSAGGLPSTPARTTPCWNMTACALGRLAPPWSEHSQGMRP